MAEGVWVPPHHPLATSGPHRDGAELPAPREEVEVDGRQLQQPEGAGQASQRQPGVGVVPQPPDQQCQGVLLQGLQQRRLLLQPLPQPLRHGGAGAGPGGAELPLQRAAVLPVELLPQFLPVVLPVLLSQRRACTHPAGTAT